MNDKPQLLICKYMTEKPDIIPTIKIRELIDAYPWLEETLVEMVPEFGKLKNPLLRNTVARITTLQQAAIIGKVDLGILINQLRKKAGLSEADSVSTLSVDKIKADHNWFNEANIKDTLDARPMLAAGRHPMDEVFDRLSKMNSGGILKLITGFVPEPLIEKAIEKGYKAYALEETTDLVSTYFYKP